MLNRILVLCVLTLSFCYNLISQPLFEPNEFFPQEYGVQFTQHHQLIDYFEHVAEVSPRVNLIQYGFTNQKRPLILAYVTSPKNQKILDDIRTNNLARAGVLKKEPRDDLDRAIVWMSFGVHGNEAGASEASINVLHRLATEKGDVEKWLENTVVIIDPCINPDGYNRYVQWYLNNSGNIINPRPESKEHDEPWPGGRINHYLFDLNRDWAWATQVETKQRLSFYQQWLPHVHNDYHEQFPGSPYYFPPAAEPYHTYISNWQKEFQIALGKNNAKYFDKERWLYFTKQYFDLFYPSYGDTYPTFNGAIGMTFEQAGHGIAGREILLENGDTLKLADRIDHHTVTALSTIETASRMKGDLVERFEKYFEDSRTNPAGWEENYIIKDIEEMPDQWGRLAHLLQLHGIEFYSAEGSGEVEGYSYREMENRLCSYDSGDVIIPVGQTKSVLLQVLFESKSKLTDSLTYDITAWSLPFAYGLDIYGTSSDIAKTGYKDPYQNWKSPKIGDAYAYIIPWKGVEDVRLVSYLQKKGVNVRVADSRLYIDGNSYPRGSIVILAADNKYHRTFPQLLSEYAVQNSHEVNPIQTGFGDRLPDLGSDKVRLIEKQKVLLLGGSETYPNDFGQVWNLLDEELSIPYTLIDAEDLNGTDLHDYSCIVVPGGYHSTIRSESTMKKLKEWMSGGGKIIALGSAVSAFTGEEGLGFDRWVSENLEAQEKEERREFEMDARLDPVDKRLRKSVSDWIPGAIVRLELDSSHPLAYGLGSHYYTLKTSSRSYEHLNNADNVGFIRDNLQSVGFIGERAKKKLLNSSSIFVVNKGRGSFVALPDNPLYRGFWEQGKLLFANALFIQP